MEPIGLIETCYPDKFGTPRQPGLVKESWARLRVDRRFQPEQAFIGLSGFSHLWLIFVFHQNSNLRYHAKVHPPRLGGESIGVFASRSPHRPNPLGLSLVELEKIDGDSLILRGVDLIDGTPILDIKPYLPDIESRPEARAGWTTDVAAGEINVEFSEQHSRTLKAWSARISQPQLKALITETLRLDPRPLVYRGLEGDSSSPYRSEHAVRFFDGDVHFRFVSPLKIEVTDIRFS
jgi:tRNA-Thr(GGU) m(6)t(6)A37 methyltransferase TsaA